METDTIQIPRKIVEEIYDTHEKISQILETLEVLMDEETLKRLKKGEEELKTGDYVDAKPEEIAELLIKGDPLSALRIASRTRHPFFRAVEIYPRIAQNTSAPSAVRKVPDTFCFTFIIRTSRSA